MKQTPRLICLRPAVSYCLVCFIVVSHLLAVMALFLSNLHGVARILLLLLIMLNFYVAWGRFIARTSARAIVAADWLSDDSWQVIDGKGEMQQVTSWTVLLNSPLLVMLSFNLIRSKTATLIICPDSLDRELRRQLRVRLNIS